MNNYPDYSEQINNPRGTLSPLDAILYIIWQVKVPIMPATINKYMNHAFRRASKQTLYRNLQIQKEKGRISRLREGWVLTPQGVMYVANMPEPQWWVSRPSFDS